jgi:hypothetical protein
MSCAGIEAIVMGGDDGGSVTTAYTGQSSLSNLVGLRSFLGNTATRASLPLKLTLCLSTS